MLPADLVTVALGNLAIWCAQKFRTFIVQVPVVLRACRAEACRERR
jgi:hypothetical protein